jgi:hypothetical protein
MVRKLNLQPGFLVCLRPGASSGNLGHWSNDASNKASSAAANDRHETLFSQLVYFCVI